MCCKKTPKGDPDENKPHPKDVKQEAPKEFGSFLDGKRPDGKRRKCTDCLCLLLLLAQWVVMTYLGVEALMTQNVRVLTNGVDYDGNICGFSSGVTGKPLWTIVSWTGLGKCVDECPDETTWSEVSWFDKDDVDLLSCRDDTDDDVWYAQYPFYKIYYGECMYQFKSTNVMNYCAITDTSLVTNIFETYFSFDDDETLETMSTVTESASFITDVFQDLFSAKYYILGIGFGASTLLSFGYAYAMRVSFITKFIVWGSIWSVFFFALALAGYCYYYAGIYANEVPQTKEESEIQTMEVISCAGFGVAMIWLCVILYLKDRITLAIALVIETFKAICSMPVLIFLVPALQVLAYVAFTIPWTLMSVYLAASGDITTHSATKTVGVISFTYAYKEVTYDEDLQNTGWFFLFGYFWTTQFIVACGQMIVAMALCCYYFTRDKSKIGNTTVLTALRLVCRYHLGTVAFGSFLIAVVKLVRAYIEYLERTALKDSTRLQKLLLRILKCFMYCIERCIKYINLNAYIQTCIWGTSFCTSAFNAFWLIFRNIARIAAVTGVTHFLGFIGKVTVVVLTGGTFYYIVNIYYADQVNSLIIPTLMVCTIAAFIAMMFFEVFGMGTTVLLQCFVADEEMFADDPDGCYAEDSLKRYLGSHHKKSKKKKASKKDGE